MARIHPSFPLNTPTTLGAYRERDILKLLEKGLDNRFDVFHNLPWSGMQGEQQSFGEYDFVIVSPGGQLLILGIKAGDVTESDDGLTKNYGRQGPKDIGHQMRRMHSSLLQRIDSSDLPQVHVGAMLVLPDHKIQSASVSYPTRTPGRCKPNRPTLPAHLGKLSPSNPASGPTPACAGLFGQPL